jgi:predicted 2-oxoglutarate/Fe(II)-dependent dioxygenase YbiX
MDIESHTAEIRALYSSESLLRLLSKIAGVEVLPLDDPIEKYVINALFGLDDQHGAHLDSFPFACSLLAEVPNLGCGGSLEMQVLGPRPRFEFHPVPLSAGSLVFFRSAEIVHRVTPLTAKNRRIVLSMAYATAGTRGELSNSRALLYS